MAVKFPFVSALICERVLLEQDGIASAIRAVDVFNIPAEAPPDPVIQFWLFASLKTVPVPDATFRFGVTLIRVNGEREKLTTKEPGKLPIYEGDASIPSGINIMLQVNIIARNMGTAYLEIDIDGEPITRVPFTMRRLPKPDQPTPELKQ